MKAVSPSPSSATSPTSPNAAPITSHVRTSTAASPTTRATTTRAAMVGRLGEQFEPTSSLGDRSPVEHGEHSRQRDEQDRRHGEAGYVGPIGLPQLGTGGLRDDGRTVARAAAILPVEVRRSARIRTDGRRQRRDRGAARRRSCGQVSWRRRRASATSCAHRPST